ANTMASVFRFTPTTLMPVNSGQVALGTSSNPFAASFLQGLKLTNITGSTQCLHVDTTGLISGTGTDCGSGAGANTALSNLAAPTLINVSLWPATGGAVALGRADLPWSDVFIGGAANKSVDFNVSGLAANRQWIFPDISDTFVGVNSGDATPSAGQLAVWSTHVSSLKGVAAPAGTIVGTTDTQTLTNKTVAASGAGGSNTITAS